MRKVIKSTDDMAILKVNDTMHAHFASVDAFIRYNAEESRCDCMNTDSNWTHHTDGARMIEYITTRTMNDDIMERLNAQLELDVTGLKGEDNVDVLTLDDSGFMCDMASYFAGEEQCMFNINQQYGDAKTVWLTSSIVSCANVSAETMVNRGVALIRAVKTLQAHNYSVGLATYCHGSKYPNNVFITTVVKRPDEPLNETLVAAAFAHPSYFRTLTHNTAARITNQDSGGMSDTSRPTHEMFKESFLDSGTVGILSASFLYQDAETPEKAEEWITAEVEKLIEQQQQENEAAA
jgi:hypothetical protein